MAIAKVILNGETLMDVTSDTVTDNTMVNGIIATKNDGTKVTGNIASKSSSDLTVSGATVTAPAGVYTSAASKSVSTTTHPNPSISFTSSTGVVTASHAQTTGYVTSGTTTSTYNLTTQAAQTIYPSTADQTISSYRWLTGTQTIKSVTTTNLTAANIAEGVTVKVGDATNASRITQIVGAHGGSTSYTATISGSGNSTYCYVTYNGTKYYTNGGTFTYKAGDTLTIYCRGNNATVNGDSVTLSSYSYTYTLPVGDVTINLSYSSSTNNSIAVYGLIQPSGTYSVSAAGNHNIYKYSIASVPTGSAFPPATTITTNPSFTFVSSTGKVTASYTGTSYVTPTITAGWVTTGTSGVISTTGTSTYTLTTQAAQTIYPSTADQTVASYRWLIGTQTIKSVVTSNLTAANIAEGVIIKIGDTTNASRIAQITGTYGGGNDLVERCILEHNFYSISSHTYENSTLRIIGKYAFTDTQYLSYVSIPNVSQINEYAFSSVTTLQSIYAPLVKIIGQGAFDNCNYLISVSFPLVTDLHSSIFTNCSRLTSAYFPSVTTINDSVFYSCYALSNLYMPNLTTGAWYNGGCFAHCSALSEVNFPKLDNIGNYMFNWCTNLKTVSLGNSNITSVTIRSGAFMVCYNLLSLYLYYGAVPSLLSNSVFHNSPISNNTTSTGGVYGKIYVPSSLYNSYKTATNWTVYSSRFVSM